MMIFENFLIYFPKKYPEGNWQPRGLDVEDASFTAADGTRLHGWYVEHKNPRQVVLFAHGNAGNLADRDGVLRILHDQLRVSVMIFDYRGYGRSDGSPSERGILQDGQAARDWLAERAGIEPHAIVLMGRSLGGAVVAHLAAQDGARGLVLESTFSSLPDVAAVHYWWLPIRWLMKTQLDSASKIHNYHGPLLQSHSHLDEIIPLRIGERLFQAAPSAKKQFVKLTECMHNDPQPDAYYRELDAFLEGLE